MTPYFCSFEDGMIPVEGHHIEKHVALYCRVTDYEKLEAHTTALRGALEFYADEQNWKRDDKGASWKDGKCQKDRGAIAQSALTKKENNNAAR